MSVSLFIDTTLNGVSVACVSGKKTWTGFHDQRGDADSAICKMVDEGLKDLSQRVKDIDSIIVSHGPGSFTGIKVGLSWAYGFQAGRKEDLLVGMSSLAEANSELSLQKKARTVLVLPISKREAFLSWQNEKGEHHFSSIVLFSDAAETDLKKLSSEGYEFFLISVESKTKEWVQTLSKNTHEIAMLEFMKLALEAMIRKAGTLDLSKLKQRMITPHYLKKTTVEEKFEGKSHDA